MRGLTDRRLTDQFAAAKVTSRFPGCAGYVSAALLLRDQSIICLSVCIIQVPPYFLNTSLESDATLTVKEYTDVSLPCKAAANPIPVVTWRREDGQQIPAKVPAKGKTDICPPA